MRVRYLYILKVFLFLERGMHRPRLRIKLFHWWLRKLWVLSTVDGLFLGLILNSLYLTLGEQTSDREIQCERGRERDDLSNERKLNGNNVKFFQVRGLWEN